MTERSEKTIHEKYDDITANLYAGAEYMVEIPTFEEFAEFYGHLVDEFFHNAELGHWQLADGASKAAIKTTDELRREWEQRIFSWLDVEEYVTAWIAQQLGTTK